MSPLSGTVRVAGVVRESITDGPGLRYTLFLQGCSHRCPGCHNPGTHEPAGGEARPLGGLWAEISGNLLLSGVTLSGGEPFEQARALLPLAKKIRCAGLELAVYSGYTFEQLAEQGGDAAALLGQCQVLVDGLFRIDERDLGLRFRGSRNQRILDVAASLSAGRAIEMCDGRW